MAAPRRPAADPPDAFLPGSQLFLVPAGYYTVHSLEELPGFADWVGRHFSATSELAFAVFGILTLSLVLVAGHRAVRQEAHGGWVVLAVAAQVQFGLNALFHLVTAALFAEYSPGMVTAGSLGLLLTPWFLARVWREERVTGREMLAAAVLGAAVAAAAIGLLFL